MGIVPPKRPKIVGDFIRKRRTALKLSQRALGVLFQPPVTTQFISNVERGVTPLPPVHVSTLAQALQVPAETLMDLLEREYALKLNGRLGRSAEEHSSPAPQELFLKELRDAFLRADVKTRDAFAALCESVLHVPKRPL